MESIVCDVGVRKFFIFSETPMNNVVYRAANYKCTICGTFFSSIDTKPQCPKCGSLGPAVMIKIKGNSK